MTSSTSVNPLPPMSEGSLYASLSHREYKVSLYIYTTLIIQHNFSYSTNQARCIYHTHINTYIHTMIINVPFQLQVDSLSIFFIRLDPTALRLFCREKSRCVASEKACERETQAIVLELIVLHYLSWLLSISTLFFPLGVFATAKHTKTGN